MTEHTSTNGSLGELIRERRLGMGLSLGQLATEVNTSANQVRRWERGEETPDREAQVTLADFLGIDAALVSSLAAEEIAAAELADEEPETPTEVFSEASGVSPASVSPPREAETGPPVTPSGQGQVIEPEREAVPETSARREETAGEVAVDTHEPTEPPLALEPAPEAQAQLQEPGAATAAAFGDAPESTIAPRPVPLRYPESVPPGVPVEITEPEPNRWNPLRYLYDPEKPWLYWARAGLTVVVLLVLVNVLFDSVSELFDKLGELLDTIEPTENIEELEPGTP